MKLLSTLCLVACELLSSCQKVNNSFVVRTVFTKHKKSIADFKKANSFFYQDSAFTASAFCMGEFGGHLFLQDRKTCVVYECIATCPLALHIIEGKYLATTTLAHGTGFSQVLEIVNPHLLTTRPVLDSANKVVEIPVITNPVFKTGTRVLADTMNLLTIGSFVRKKQLYHIMTDFRNTYLAKSSSTRFIIIDTIANFSTMTYDPKILHTPNGHSVTLFKNDKTQGHLDVYGDSITIFRYQ